MAKLSVTPLSQNHVSNLSTDTINPSNYSVILLSSDKVVVKETINGQESIQAYYGTFSGPSSIAGITGTINKIEYDYADNLPTWTLSDMTAAWRDVFSGTYKESNLYSGNDLLYGWYYGDSLAGFTGNDTLYGGALEDVLYGNQDQDLLYGESGADTLFGGQGNDSVFGGDNEDLIYGNLGNDFINGDVSNDTIFGGQGADTLYGGDGNDWLTGNRDNDLLIGGSGADIFSFRPGSSNDTVSDFSFVAGDRIELLRGVSYTLASALNGDAIVRLSTGDELTLRGLAVSQVTSDWFTLV
jgi:hypothetical protein